MDSVLKSEKEQNFVNVVEYKKRIETRYALTTDDAKILSTHLLSISVDLKIEPNIVYFIHFSNGTIVRQYDLDNLEITLFTNGNISRFDIRMTLNDHMFEIIFDRLIQGNRRFGVINVSASAPRQSMGQFISFFHIFTRKITSKTSRLISSIELSALSPLSVSISIVGSQIAYIMQEFGIISSLGTLYLTLVFAVIGLYLAAGGLTNVANVVLPFALIDLTPGKILVSKVKFRRNIILVAISLAFIVGLVTNLAYDRIKVLFPWIAQ